MASQLVAHRLAKRAGAATVDDADAPQAADRCVIDERSHCLASLLRIAPADVELVTEIGCRRRANTHRLRGLLGTSGRRPKPAQRDP